MATHSMTTRSKSRKTRMIVERGAQSDEGSVGVAEVGLSISERCGLATGSVCIGGISRSNLRTPSIRSTTSEARRQALIDLENQLQLEQLQNREQQLNLMLEMNRQQQQQLEECGSYSGSEDEDMFSTNKVETWKCEANSHEQFSTVNCSAPFATQITQNEPHPNELKRLVQKKLCPPPQLHRPVISANRIKLEPGINEKGKYKLNPDADSYIPTYRKDVPPRQQQSIPQPTADPVMALTQALQAVIMQPSQQMETLMARQTLGKDLPIFHGDVEEWPTFHSNFTMSTKQCNLPDCQNIVRLQKCLRGKARDAVKALLVSERNVPEIIRVLEKQFGQPTIIIRSLVDKLKKIPPPKENQFDTMIEFGDAVRNLVTTVESLEKDNYLYNPQLLEELIDKLPSNLRMQWATTVVNIRPMEPSLRTFAMWLEKITDAAIVLNRKILTFKTDEKNNNPRAQNKSATKKKDVLLSTEAEEIKPAVASSSTSTLCLYCDKVNHKIDDCRGFLRLNIKQRNEWCSKNGYCFCCFRKGHVISACRNKKNCGVNGCTKLHNKLLHNTTSNNNLNNVAVVEEIHPGTRDEQTSPEPTGNYEVNSNINFGRAVLLRVMPVKIKGPKCEISTFALCDEASSVSLIDNKLAVRLGLKGSVDPLKLRWTDSTCQEDKRSRRVSLQIRGQHEDKTFTMKNVRTVERISLPTQSVNMKNIVEKHKHLANIKFDDFVNGLPLILIGQDHQDLIIARKIVAGPRSAPMASYTRLGWIIHGNVGAAYNRVDTHFNMCTYDDFEKRDLDMLMKQTYDLDALGIIANPQHLKSKEEIRAEQLMDKYTRRIGDRFETCLLWKYDKPQLPNNRKGAIKRLIGIERKMDKSRDFSVAYCDKIDELVKKGYARKLTKIEEEKVTPKTWYLPHFFAYHPNKPTKPRLVFDAAAEYYGQSLNKNLIPGPDELKSLPGVLLNFRRHPVAFTADISEMFPQIKIRAEDQDAQRFLWRGMDRKNPPDVYVFESMIFGANCSPFTAHYIKNRNAMEHQQQYPAAAESIVDHHYMDDLADGASDNPTAIRKIRDIRYVHKQGGFVITKWSCNKNDVLNTIPEELRSTDPKLLNVKDGSSLERVLGLKWDPNEDVFQFATSFNKVNPQIIDGTKIPTKREVLKTIMSIFDPLGFINHYTIQGKILYQQIWKRKIDWDDCIPEGIQNAWKNWITRIPEVANLSIPRYYFEDSSVKKISLHILSDASSEAYACVSYIRYETDDGVKVKLLMAKARVCPLKPITIPRLELQSCVIAVRLSSYIRRELKVKIDNVHYWTDSKTVMLWLQTEVQRFKPYVAHRVGEILENSNISQWRWLPTRVNTADLATRGHPKANLKITSTWFTGPEFLLNPDDKWPRQTINEETTEPDDCEMKAEYCAVHTTIQNLSTNILPKITRFSKWSRVVRATAWVRRYILILIGKVRKLDKLPSELTVAELEWGQQMWIRKMQEESFPNELGALLKNKSIDKTSKILFLSPFLDGNNIMRVSSRTIHSPEMDRDQREPIIFDPGHRYTKLLITHYHVKALHQGQEYVVNELRQRYWILRVRAAVKSIWNSCLFCKKRKIIPPNPIMAPLPKFRVTKPSRPFTITGLDYFGPMTVTKYRKKEKRWGALFTCMHTRAVHLELVDNLSTDSVIMAMTRMAAVRGWPKKIHSDNGTNFKGAVTELNKSLAELNQSKIMTNLALKEVDWHFSPPYGPHHNGAIERLVRSVKTALRVVMTEQEPREETLRTLFCEAMEVINSRPLTYISNDPHDPEVLTPNSFLIGTTSTTPMLGEFNDRDICLKKQWRIAQRMADQFWKRWVREYLPTLTRRNKWKNNQPSVQLDDIVIIIDENLPRKQWPMGVVENVFPGKDGVVRVADIRTKTGTFRRPVVKLCVLIKGQEEDAFLV